MKLSSIPAMPVLLSVTAGYVDTAGYLVTAAVLAFASGCAAAAVLYKEAGVYCFLVPPILGAGTLMFRMTAFPGDVR